MPQVISDTGSWNPGIVNQNATIFDFPNTPGASILPYQANPTQPLPDRTTTAAIGTALSNWLTGLGFNATVYPSSVIQQIENTPGVTACRFLTGGDITGWNPATPNAFNVGIQQVNAYGTVITSYVDANGNPLDIVLGASQIPAFGNLVVVPKAANSFGAFV